MKNIRLSDQIAEKIKADIKALKFKAGEKIPAEPELMKLYDVGRSSIREAVKSLTMVGMLRVQQGAGTFVNENISTVSLEQRLSHAEFDKINAVRMLLEEEIVRLAVKNRTESDLIEMASQLSNRKLAIINEDAQGSANADIAFHTSIARASDNSVLVDLYQHFTISIRSFFAQREVKGVTHFAMSHYLHEQLFDAINGRDEQQAVSIIKNILANNY